MLLIYYRTYVTHAFLGFLFGVDDSAVGRNINPLQPLLAGIFRIPERRVELDPEEIRELFFDATERPTRRPDAGPAGVLLGQEEAAHDQDPGGGRPPHASRPARAPSRGGCGSPPCPTSFPGSVHDKKVYDRTRVVAPPGCEADGGHGLPRDRRWRRPTPQAAAGAS